MFEKLRETISGAGKTLKMMKGTRERKKETKKMKQELIKNAAKKEFKKKYGKKFVADPGSLFRVDRLRMNKMVKKMEDKYKKM